MLRENLSGYEPLCSKDKLGTLLIQIIQLMFMALNLSQIVGGDSKVP